MDILRNELDEIYRSQHLDCEVLDNLSLEESKNSASILADISGGCAVVTDASSDCCWIYAGSLAVLLSISELPGTVKKVNSSDEDEIYNIIHPEDLPDKRLLEYEFFKTVNSLSPAEKLHFRATCRLRMHDKHDNYHVVDNSTQLIRLSPAGKMWLILCRYTLSPDQSFSDDISARIINTSTGEITSLSFRERRMQILTKREKEILLLIKDGLSSKMIADRLTISVYTVNRHRQNIMEKLSVANSVEAVSAAVAMKLL